MNNGAHLSAVTQEQPEKPVATDGVIDMIYL